MKEYVLTFDIPRELASVRKKVHRDLIRIGAKKLQHSFWKSDKLQDFMTIAIFIKKAQGQATILEEKLIF